MLNRPAIQAVAQHGTAYAPAAPSPASAAPAAAPAATRADDAASISIPPSRPAEQLPIRFERPPLTEELNELKKQPEKIMETMKGDSPFMKNMREAQKRAQADMDRDDSKLPGEENPFAKAEDTKEVTKDKTVIHDEL